MRVAGLKSLLQKPPTAKGMCFISLEDETGIFNLVLTPDIYATYRLALIGTALMEVEGFLEHINGVRNIRVQKLMPLEIAPQRLLNSPLGT